MTRARWTGIAAVLAAAVLWGSTGTVQTALPDAREPLVVGALRLAIGALALLALALSRPDTRRGLARLPWRGVLFAGIAIGAYNLLFFRAVSDAGVGVGTAVTIGSAPIWATAWEIAWDRRWPGRLRGGAQGLAVLGVGLLGLGGGTGGTAGQGVALALAAGACYAAYSLATSRVGRGVPSTSLAAGTFVVAAALAAPVLALAPLGWLGAPGVWGPLIFLGIGATGLSYALYTWGLTRMAASTGVTLALAEPVTALVLAVWVVGERLTGLGVLAAGTILAGLAVVALVPAPRAPQG
ncbi:DMT family transporter [Palleronia rufa]|uniref:DMT family transporter n=1 Tax=Palleronia rufa TaxID=1530186 RepID=UPI0005686A5C|nr:DMT family transporter [Palleronia rufa]